MVIDFHVHAKIRTAYPFDKEKFLLTINEARENGLDGIAVTEHCGAHNFEDCYDFLNNNYNYINEYYDVDGFKVFFGMEVTTKQDLDILIIGTATLILELRNKIMAGLKKDEHIDINELFKIPMSQDLLVILAHPYREHIEFPKLENHVVDRLDAVEINSKDLYIQGMVNAENKVIKLAEKFKLPVVCGSDTHYFIQASSVRNVFENNCKTVKEIKEQIKLCKYNREYSTELNVRVKSSIIIKKLICNK